MTKFVVGVAGAILLGWFLRTPFPWMWWATMFTYCALFLLWSIKE